MTEFVTHYPHLCEKCNRMIGLMAAHMSEFKDADDPEAPIMKAADNRLLCGGRTCRHGWSIGDTAWYDGQIVTLTGYSSGGGMFDAESETGETLYPDPEDLSPVPEFLPEIEELDAAIIELQKRIGQKLENVAPETPTETISVEREREALRTMGHALTDMGHSANHLYNTWRRYRRAYA